CPPGGSALRRTLAARLVETYSSPGAVIADLVTGRGETIAAAAAAGRKAVALHSRRGDGPRRPKVKAVADAIDLAIALPPACCLWPPRAHPLSAATARILTRRTAPLLRPGAFLVLSSLGREHGSEDPVTGTVT